MGLIQNSIALPTTAHFLDQKRAIYQKLKLMIDAAGASGVNILCLQVSNVTRLNYFHDFIFYYYVKFILTFYVFLI